MHGDENGSRAVGSPDGRLRLHDRSWTEGDRRRGHRRRRRRSPRFANRPRHRAAGGDGGRRRAWLGSEIGRSLDENDRREAERSAQVALERNPDGRASTWQNPNSGHSGATTPTRTYETAGGPCREYTTSVVIDGKTQTAHGTACREPDGTWRIES
jgi:surface antigen